MRQLSNPMTAPAACCAAMSVRHWFPTHRISQLISAPTPTKQSWSIEHHMTSIQVSSHPFREDAQAAHAQAQHSSDTLAHFALVQSPLNGSTLPAPESIDPPLPDVPEPPSVVPAVPPL